MNLSRRRIQRFSPILCRLLARHRYGKPLTTAEIAQRGGYRPHEVEALSEECDSDNVPFKHWQRFAAACGIYFDVPARIPAEDYLQKTLPASLHLLLFGTRRKGQQQSKPFTYLKRDPLWKTEYQPLMNRWLDHLMAQAGKRAHD